MPEPNTAPGSATPPWRVRQLRNLIGIALLVSALAGVLLPLLQGVLMVLAGVLLIDLPVKQRAHRWLLRFAPYERATSWLKGSSPRKADTD
jgi:uncharacterized membrane protein HdeD (DUF308 family)